MNCTICPQFDDMSTRLWRIKACPDCALYFCAYHNATHLCMPLMDERGRRRMYTTMEVKTDDSGVPKQLWHKELK